MRSTALWCRVLAGGSGGGPVMCGFLRGVMSRDDSARVSRTPAPESPLGGCAIIPAQAGAGAPQRITLIRRPQAETSVAPMHGSTAGGGGYTRGAVTALLSEIATTLGGSGVKSSPGLMNRFSSI